MIESTQLNTKSKIRPGVKNSLALFIRGVELGKSQENILFARGIIDVSGRLTEAGRRLWDEINHKH